MEFLLTLTQSSIPVLPESVLFFGGLFGFLFLISLIILIFVKLFSRTTKERTIDFDQVFLTRDRIKSLLAILFVQSLPKNIPSFRNRLIFLGDETAKEDWLNIYNSSTKKISPPFSVESPEYRAFVQNDLRLYYSLKVFLAGFDLVLKEQDLLDLSKNNSDLTELTESASLSDKDLIDKKHQWLKQLLKRILSTIDCPPTTIQVLIYSQSFLLAQYLDFAKIKPMSPPDTEIALIALNQAFADQEVSGINVFNQDVVLPDEWDRFISQVIECLNNFKLTSLPLSIEVARLNMVNPELEFSSECTTVFYTAKHKEDLSVLLNSLNIPYTAINVSGEIALQTNLSPESTNELVTSIHLLGLEDVSISSSIQSEGQVVEIIKKQLVSEIIKKNQETIDSIKRRQDEISEKLKKEKLSPEMLKSVDFWLAFKSCDEQLLSNRSKLNQTLDFFREYIDISKCQETQESDGSYAFLYIYKFIFSNRKIELNFIQTLVNNITKIENISLDIDLNDIPQDSLLHQAVYHVRESEDEYIEFDMQSMLNPFTERISSTGIYSPIIQYLKTLLVDELSSINNISDPKLPPAYTPGRNPKDARNLLVLRSRYWNPQDKYKNLIEGNACDGLSIEDIPMLYEIAYVYNVNISIAYDKDYMYAIFDTTSKNFSLVVIEAKISQIYSSDLWEVLENVEISRCRITTADLPSIKQNPSSLDFTSFNTSKGEGYELQ